LKKDAVEIKGRNPPAIAQKKRIRLILDGRLGNVKKGVFTKEGGCSGYRVLEGWRALPAGEEEKKKKGWGIYRCQVRKWSGKTTCSKEKK